MFPKIVIFFISFHVIVGIVIPNLFLIFRTIRGTVTKKLRHLLRVWKFGELSLFFLGMALCMLTFFGDVGVEGKIGLTIGVLSLGLFALFFLRQARIQLIHWKGGNKE